MNRKIKRSFCPPGVVENNPVLDYCRSIIFPALGSLTVERSADNGGDKCAILPRCLSHVRVFDTYCVVCHFVVCRTYTMYEELERDFVSLVLHPGDLNLRWQRRSCTDRACAKHFAENAAAAAL